MVDMYMSFNEVFDILNLDIFENPVEEVPEDILKKAKQRDKAK